MRASVILISALLIAALLALDSYEYDGHYRKAFWGEASHDVEKVFGK
jgi:hypothetical protein